MIDTRVADDMGKQRQERMWTIDVDMAQREEIGDQRAHQKFIQQEHCDTDKRKTENDRGVEFDFHETKIDAGWEILDTRY